MPMRAQICHERGQGLPAYSGGLEPQSARATLSGQPCRVYMYSSKANEFLAFEISYTRPARRTFYFVAVT